ncbi:MAG: PKD domain-containing protein [Marinilabiliaceae bacterium]|nr:PKD domain-containing protein [Marinilabiliaceae bacterium]
MAAGIISMRTVYHRSNIRAVLGPTTLEVGQELSFADSTEGAESWLWEFGNGDQRTQSRGTYFFSEPGKYQVRLTVNNWEPRYFMVHVRDQVSFESSRPMIQITAPEVAFQDEIIVFKGVGEAREWRWEFGETGMVDAREKNCMYAYKIPGIYEVQLSTDNTQYPVRFEIEILPVYQENDTTDVLSIIGLDIKRKLQEIAHGRAFNFHYNTILQQYLCQNPNVLVVVNNNKFNDFYSYCQGLRITGKGNGTLIENVIVDMDSESVSCVKQLNVIQYDDISIRTKK